MPAPSEPPAPTGAPSNSQIADSLEEVARLLEEQGANMFRVRAYRTAAANLRRLAQPVGEIVNAKGTSGLLELPGIGYSLARSIDRMCHTGRLPLLQRLRGEAGPEHLFMTLPGIGLEYATRIHEQLGVESLPELESAARDGRLAKVPGMGPKRLRGIQEALRGRMRWLPESRFLPAESPSGEPKISEILDVDREYREKAEKDQLRRISPRRLNPSGEPWLPILHTQRGDRQYTALYSNTPRAHDLGMTHDWVVVFRDDHDGHGQWTVITSRFGPLLGKRIVRGRESECAAYYSQISARNESISD